MIAADLSFRYGFDGYVYGEAMDAQFTTPDLDHPGYPSDDQECAG